jgi:hypothetical protein
MNVCGYEFQYVSDLEPVRTSDGSILTSMPQDRYHNQRCLPINKYGAGPFCKFKIPNRYQLSGVYVVTVNDEVRYRSAPSFDGSKNVSGLNLTTVAAPRDVKNRVLSRLRLSPSTTQTIF